MIVIDMNKKDMYDAPQWENHWSVSDKDFLMHHMWVLSCKYSMSTGEIYLRLLSLGNCSLIALEHSIRDKRLPKCKHSNRYMFHDNAPSYCPDCSKFVDGVIDEHPGK